MTRYCPKCRGEFQDRVETCIDCRTRLVDELPETGPESVSGDYVARGVELVTVATFNHDLEAEVGRAKLESAGIPGIVVSAYGLGSRWRPEAGFGGMQLQVRKADFELAQQILNDVPENAGEDVFPDLPEASAEEVDEIAEEVPPTADAGRRCPVCGSTDIRGRALSFLGGKKRCRRCFHEWR